MCLGARWPVVPALRWPCSRPAARFRPAACAAGRPPPPKQRCFSGAAFVRQVSGALGVSPRLPPRAARRPFGASRRAARHPSVSPPFGASLVRCPSAPGVGGARRPLVGGCPLGRRALALGGLGLVWLSAWGSVFGFAVVCMGGVQPDPNLVPSLLIFSQQKSYRRFGFFAQWKVSDKNFFPVRTNACRSLATLAGLLGRP